MSSHAPGRTRPKSVALAVNLIWLGIALAVISLVVNFFLLDDSATSAGISFIDQQNAGGTAAVAVLIALVIGIGIPALLAIFIGRGHNWARIIYTILGAIGVIQSLLGLIAASQLGAVSVVLQLVGLVLTLATLFLLFRPDANAYFKS